jgi:cell division protein FtsQ
VARPRTRAVAAPRPRGRKPAVPLSRWLPSAKSVAVGVGLLALAGGAYGVARETSAFAVTRVEVVGAPIRVRAQVRQAVAPLRGGSLLSLDGAALIRRVDALPTIVVAGYDRAFPHTLRITVVPEQPVAVVRQGGKSWLASARGRVMARVAPHAAQALPRVWIPHTTPVRVGGFLPMSHAGAVARSLSLAQRFPAHVVLAALKRDGLLFRLRSGLELRLGEPTDIRLKLAIAARALHRMPAGMTYLDVSVPGRPVAGNNPQVSGGD